MISLPTIFAGIVVITFAGVLGYVIGKINSRMMNTKDSKDQKGCYNCDYFELYDDEEPCDECVDHSRWEPVDENM